MSFIEAGVMSIKQGICVFTSSKVCSFIAPALRLYVAQAGAGPNLAIQSLPKLGRERLAMGQLTENHHQQLVPAAKTSSNCLITKMSKNLQNYLT
jgi:hypothetical protein